MALSLLERALRAPGITPEHVVRAAKKAGLVDRLPYLWRALARPEQLPPPGRWRVWLILAGRGFGKTRSGAEWIRDRIVSGKAKRIALVGATAADVRDTMVEGQSGLLAVFPPEERPIYIPSKRRVIFPKYPGVIATLYTAEKPRQLRGPEHDTAWADEACFWKDPEAFDHLLFGLRIGEQPQVVMTTTPRPSPMLRRIMGDPRTVIRRGSTFDNASNLHPDFIADMKARYEGTHLGRQELFAEVMDDVEGALWHRELIEASRVKLTRTLLDSLVRVVVAVDPAVTAGPKSDETGIVVCGQVGRGRDAEYFALEDFSLRGTPGQWAKQVKRAYDLWEADLVIGEANNGGDLVETNIRTVAPRIPFKAVRASRGKAKRAEPIAALWEQKRAHVVGTLARLEDQMCTFLPGAELIGESPDRMDALVWGMTELSAGSSAAGRLRSKVGGERSNPWRTA